jgi:hypothetical protein
LVDLLTAAHVMTVWHDDPHFLSPRGEPLMLRLRGAEKSFEALIRAVDPQLNFKDVLAFLVRTGSVKRRQGRYWAARKEVLVRHIPGELALRALRATNWMLRNADQNSRPASVAPPWLERCAENSRFPVRRLAEFATFFERETESYLRRIDEFLRSEEVNSRPREPTLLVGVGLYGYQARVARSPKRPPRRRR